MLLHPFSGFNKPGVTMKSSNRFALLATVVVALSSLSTAAVAVSANGNASATVLTPITITTGNTLNFGSFAPAATAGTLVVNTAGTTRTPGGGVIPSGTTFTGGTFTIAGANVGFSIAAPASFSVNLTGAPSMVVTLSGIGTSGTIAGGSITYPFGGSLAVGAAAVQTAGVYTGAFSMTVEYN